MLTCWCSADIIHPIFIIWATLPIGTEHKVQPRLTGKPLVLHVFDHKPKYWTHLFYLIFDRQSYYNSSQGGRNSTRQMVRWPEKPPAHSNKYLVGNWMKHLSIKLRRKAREKTSSVSLCVLIMLTLRQQLHADVSRSRRCCSGYWLFRLRLSRHKGINVTWREGMLWCAS